MSEIPEDVKAAARKLCAEYEVDNPHGFEEQIIARAIMAERERCAKIADKLAAKHTGGPGSAARAIAAAIRRGN